MDVRVRGVDFSGAADPGESLWLAAGRIEDGDGRVSIDRCEPARTAFDATGRGAVLAGLREWLAAGDAGSATGIDASFGLPRALVPDCDSWRAVLAWVGDRFRGADGRSMQAALRERARASDADGVDLKRRTDGPTGASSPYSVFTRYGTLHAMRDVLGPLVEAGRIGVEPMVPAPASGPDPAPAVLEVYPAGTLRALGLPDERYKGGGHPDARDRRARILDGLGNRGVGLPVRVREHALADDGGDALDACLATVAAARAARAGFAVVEERYDPLEGYIYV